MESFFEITMIKSKFVVESSVLSPIEGNINLLVWIETNGFARYAFGQKYEIKYLININGKQNNNRH